MTKNITHAGHEGVAVWAKRCYLAGRAMMDATLRPYDLGATQWQVLSLLAPSSTAKQRDLLRWLQIERATLSIIVRTLVRKGLVEQVPDPVDQRQKSLRLTTAGKALWQELPDLKFIRSVAFDGIPETEIEIATRVLKLATERLTLHLKEDDPS